MVHSQLRPAHDEKMMVGTQGTQPHERAAENQQEQIFRVEHRTAVSRPELQWTRRMK